MVAMPLQPGSKRLHGWEAAKFPRIHIAQQLGAAGRCRKALGDKCSTLPADGEAAAEVSSGGGGGGGGSQ